ncbi:SMR family transporter, partial [Escherichia coli]
MKGWLFLVIAIVGEVIATSDMTTAEGASLVKPSLDFNADVAI